MNIRAYEKKVNSNKNRNTRFVKIRQDRQCYCCKKVLKSNTKCLTTNTKGKGRHWYCMRCVKGILEYKARNQDGINRNCQWLRAIMNVLIDLDNLPYYDEGGAEADYDALAEYEEKCLDCGRCNFSEMLYSDALKLY